MTRTLHSLVLTNDHDETFTLVLTNDCDVVVIKSHDLRLKHHMATTKTPSVSSPRCSSGLENQTAEFSTMQRGPSGNMLRQTH